MDFKAQLDGGLSKAFPLYLLDYRSFLIALVKEKKVSEDLLVEVKRQTVILKQCLKMFDLFDGLEMKVLRVEGNRYCWKGDSPFDKDVVRLDRESEVVKRVQEESSVHPMRDADVDVRLGNGHVCVIVYHRDLPTKPLACTEVYLDDKITSRMKFVEDVPVVGDPLDRDTAIFYQVKSMQLGLSGLAFGKKFINGAMGYIVEKLPQVKTCSTLSPLPSFTKFLNDDHVMDCMFCICVLMDSGN